MVSAKSRWAFVRPRCCAAISLSITAGTWVGGLGPYAEELRVVTPGTWNVKGTGLRAATNLLKRFPGNYGDDAKSALGILLWVLADAGEEVRELEQKDDL